MPTPKADFTCGEKKKPGIRFGTEEECRAKRQIRHYGVVAVNNPQEEIIKKPRTKATAQSKAAASSKAEAQSKAAARSKAEQSKAAATQSGRPVKVPSKKADVPNNSVSPKSKGNKKPYIPDKAVSPPRPEKYIKPPPPQPKLNPPPTIESMEDVENNPPWKIIPLITDEQRSIYHKPFYKKNYYHYDSETKKSEFVNYDPIVPYPANYLNKVIYKTELGTIEILPEQQYRYNGYIRINSEVLTDALNRPKDHPKNMVFNMFPKNDKIDSAPGISGVMLILLTEIKTVISEFHRYLSGKGEYEKPLVDQKTITEFDDAFTAFKWAQKELISKIRDWGNYIVKDPETGLTSKRGRMPVVYYLEDARLKMSNIIYQHYDKVISHPVLAFYLYAMAYYGMTFYDYIKYGQCMFYFMVYSGDFQNNRFNATRKSTNAIKFELLSAGDILKTVCTPNKNNELPKTNLIYYYLVSGNKKYRLFENYNISLPDKNSNSSVESDLLLQCGEMIDWVNERTGTRDPLYAIKTECDDLYLYQP